MPSGYPAVSQPSTRETTGVERPAGVVSVDISAPWWCDGE
jgi:hypothetical protein